MRCCSVTCETPSPRTTWLPWQPLSRRWTESLHGSLQTKETKTMMNCQFPCPGSITISSLQAA
ncbi:hypothetical protein DPMN_146247 [Dreissena polymorpha]|uniref:Uncharacterized protein n=1 Tax=Dreissena polymorpha TaxID=45954 RepID=A0A9D4F896_DREPO|nr:hypothetical protein DPMN_146247 [Dreissena polymorpha]